MNTKRPLYVSIPKAASLAGVTITVMRAWANREHNPIPHIVVGENGGRTLIEAAGIQPFLRSIQYGDKQTYPSLDDDALDDLAQRVVTTLRAVAPRHKKAGASDEAVADPHTTKVSVP
jgi:hypothetical protein